MCPAVAGNPIPGATELAGTGVSLSLFTTITRLVNAPLLAVATTSTAAALGRSGDERSEEVSQASTAVLVIAGIVGVAEVLLLSAGGQSGLELWGLPGGSDVYGQAAGVTKKTIILRPLIVCASANVA